MKIAAVFSIKGGEGKTTLTIAAADYLSCRRDQKILLVDYDRQGSLSDHYARDRDRSVMEADLLHIFSQENDEELLDVLRRYILPDVQTIEGQKGGIDLIACRDYNLDDLERGELPFPLRVTAAINLEKALRGLDYDIVIFDLPPAQPFKVLPFLSICDIVSIPVTPSEISTNCLELTLELIKKSQEYAPDQRVPDQVKVVFSRIRPIERHQMSMANIDSYLRTTAPLVNVTSTRASGGDGLLEKGVFQFRADERTILGKKRQNANGRYASLELKYGSSALGCIKKAVPNAFIHTV